MKKTLLILLTSLLPTAYCLLPTATCFSQNLVPNSSFEQYDTCPTYESLIRYAVPWFQPIVPAWNGSSDLFRYGTKNMLKTK